MDEEKNAKIKYCTLDNGLKIVMQKKEGASITFKITLKVGSINEKDGERGFSHLIEHLLFEGTKKRNSAREITEEIENLGGEFNAATSNETTSFYIKILKKHAKVALDILSDIILNSTFEKYEKEKKVVLEEMKMLLDNPRYYQWIFFENKLFEKTRYSKPVYGNIDDIKKATKNSIINYYKKYYIPSNAIFSIAGDYEKDILDLIKQRFSKWNGKKIDEKIEIPKNKKRIYSEGKNIQQTYITLGFIADKITSEDSPALELIEAMLGKPQSGMIIDEVRNKEGLAYDISVVYENFINFSFFAINAAIIPAKKEIVLKKIKQQIERIKKGHFTEQDIVNAKQHIEGKTLLENEDTHHIAERLAFWNLMAGKDYNEEYLEKIKKIKKTDIIKISKKHFCDNLTITELCPEKTT